MRNFTQQLAVVISLLFLPLTSVLADSLVADARFNNDGLFNGEDVQGFVDALLSP